MKLDAAIEMTKERKVIEIEAFGNHNSGRRPGGGDPGKGKVVHQAMHVALANRGFKTNPGFSGKTFQGYSHPQGHDVMTTAGGDWVHGSGSAQGKLTVGNGADSLGHHLDSSGIKYDNVIHPRVGNSRLG